MTTTDSRHVPGTGQGAGATGRKFPVNERLRGKALREACKISEATQKSIDESKTQFSFSQSRTDSLLRVARTIADMVGSDAVEKWHFEEAVNYRRQLPALRPQDLCLRKSAKKLKTAHYELHAGVEANSGGPLPALPQLRR